MAQSRAVLESEACEWWTSDAGVSFFASVFGVTVELVGTAGEGTPCGADPEPFSISRIGFTPESIAGSFDISSGFDKSDDNRSPPPVPGEGIASCSSCAGGEIFPKIEESISSCLASLRVFSFWVIIYPRLPFLKFLISSAARERSPSFAIESA